MEAPPIRPQLVAVDTNVLFDLADKIEDVVEAMAVIAARLPSVRFLVPPTVQNELGHWIRRGSRFQQRRAEAAVRIAADQDMTPGSLVAVGHGIAEQVARRMCERRLLPEAEVHDALLVAEAALLGCGLVLSSDEHLRGMEFERLSFELQQFDLTAPVIATPREIVRKFFR